MFKVVKRFYDKGFYTVEDVAKFVSAGKITEDEFFEIVGEIYSE